MRTALKVTISVDMYHARREGAGSSRNRASAAINAEGTFDHWAWLRKPLADFSLLIASPAICAAHVAGWAIMTVAHWTRFSFFSDYVSLKPRSGTSGENGARSSGR